MEMGEIGDSMPVSVLSRINRCLARLAGAMVGGWRALFGVTAMTATVVPDRNGANGGEPGRQASGSVATASEPAGSAPQAGTEPPATVKPQAPGRIRILDVRPQIDGGRFATKRTVGEPIEVSAEAFRDGHDAIRAVLRHRAPEGDWGETAMTWIDREVDGDRGVGTFTPDREGIWTYEVGAFTDHFATWHDEVSRKRAAGGEDLTSEVEEGAVLLREAEPTANLIDGQRIAAALAIAEDATADLEAKLDAVLAPRLLEAVERDPARRDFVTSEPLRLEVERERARFGAWYELSRAPGAASTASAPSYRAWRSSAST